MGDSADHESRRLRMRKILFRGKDKDSGRWYTGGYVKLADTTYCFAEDYEHARILNTTTSFLMK